MDNGFWRAHGSITFTFAVLVASLISLLLSAAVRVSHPFTALLLDHLAAMGIAAFVAAVFLSFRDVKEILSKSISALIIDGGFAAHLGTEEQTKLQRLLLLRSLQNQVRELPESLTAHLDSVTAHCIRTPYLENFNVTVVLTDAEDLPGVLHQHFRSTYTVNCRHLKGGRGIFQVLFRHEYNDTSGRLAPGGALKLFHLEVGPRVFDAKDVTVTERQSGGTKVTLVSFSADVEVNGEASVRLCTEALFDMADPTQIVYASYPTKGFRASLQFKEGMTYDAAWFKSSTDVARDFPGREQLETLPNGIAAYTDGWLLPGNGVALFWFKAQSVPTTGTRLTEPPAGARLVKNEIAAV
jgi:hypothetical protein